MPADRGPYRAITGVLLDGPDFQLLPERARFAFIVTKINFGPAGIDVFYPHALAATVAAQTGMPFGAALEHVQPGGTLHQAAWLEWEQNVVWVVGQLEHEPNMKPSDPKHRKSIQRHMMGLPHLPIVAQFIQAHAEWFPFDAEGLDDVESDNLAALQWAMVTAYEGPSHGAKKAPVTTDNRVPSTEDREPKTETASSDKSDGGAAVEQVFWYWLKTTGRDPNRTKLTSGRRAKIVARLRTFTTEQLKQAIDGLMLSEHHTSKPEWTDLVSCFGNDEKVENHIARKHSPPKPKAALARPDDGPRNGADRPLPRAHQRDRVNGQTSAADLLDQMPKVSNG